jgi:serine/threonine-protein kinase
VHRDVSPHNVLISRAGAVKLADFGIAKATAATGAALSASIKGKVSYMAPEQARGEAIDARADLFAVGVMLYELLAGERPFEGGSESEILARLLLQKCAPLGERAPAAPRELVAVVERLMAPRPADRFASASEAREAITAWRGYPADGVSAVAAWVRRLVPVVTANTPAAPATPLAAGTPKPDTTAAAPTRTRFAPSRRTLAVLAVLAALSVTAAVLVWTVPLAREPTAPRSAPPAASVPAAEARAADAAPPSPVVVEPELPPRAPAVPAAARAIDAGTVPIPELSAPDAGRTPRKGAGWEVDPDRSSPDMVPR